MKFGRIPPQEIVDLGRYLLVKLADGRMRLVAKFGAHFNRAAAAAPPAKIDYGTQAMDAIKRMYLNDTYGDCVIAGKYHGIGIWTGNDDTAGQQAALQGTDNEVLNSYHTICGPGDNGCVITDVLDYWKKTGLICAGQTHKIDNYVAVDWTNKLEVQVALLLFGGIDIGINLPQAWTSTNTTWSTPSGSGARVVGDHDIRVFDYNETGPRAATWGGIVQFTWDAFLHKASGNSWGIEEAYTNLGADWYGSDKLAINGVDAATLAADLSAIGGGTIPPIDPPTPVPPVPPVPVPPTPGQTVTIHIPEQVCVRHGTGFTVPAFTVQGTIDAKK